MKPLDENQKTSADQFGCRSANYGRSHILADVSDVEAALREVQLSRGAPALDVATGGGHTALYLARTGCRVTICDITPAMLRAAADLLEEEGFSCVSKLCPAEEMPFSDASFAIVTCRVAPHHFTSPRKFVEEAARLLQPGGWFLLIDGSVPDDSHVTADWLHAVEKLRDPSHGRFLSRSAWEELVDRAGLELRLSKLNPMKQPNLEWYFETAGTSAANRTAAMSEIESAPPEVIEKLRLGREGERIVWWWPRLTLLARKPD